MNLLPDLCLAPTCIHQFIPGRFYYLIFFKTLSFSFDIFVVCFYVCIYLFKCMYYQLGNSLQCCSTCYVWWILRICSCINDAHHKKNTNV